VLNTIVEKVQVPEDRAIILAGYEHQMSEMFRGANPGLSSRFDFHSPWRFDDFSDDDLFKVARAHVDKSGFSDDFSFDVLAHLIKTVSKKRLLANFGNARDVETVCAKQLKSCAYARACTQEDAFHSELFECRRSKTPWKDAPFVCVRHPPTNAARPPTKSLLPMSTDELTKKPSWSRIL
jgi:hypothetical protein